jgi:hypothetical protein
MSRLLGAMKLKIREIVLVEECPFTFADFREFEISGQKYHMKDGTFRNLISKLRKSGEVELPFRSRPEFYTPTGKKFNRTMTLDHVGVTNAIIDQSALKVMPIYNWLKRQPMEKQSLHNIRLRFDSAVGLWDIYSKMNTFIVNPDNKDIILPTSVYFDYLEVAVTIHHTNTVSVAISSFKPIAVDIPDILPLCEALTRTEINLANIIDGRLDPQIVYRNPCS